MKSTLFSFIALFLSLPALHAQAPGKISYQAVVRGSSNEILSSSNVGVKFSLIQGAIDGTVVYSETHFSETSLGGVVSLEIGMGEVLTGEFNQIDWSNGPYFIQTETDPLGGTNYTISGTTELLSVPYALHAKTAENITGRVPETPWETSGANVHYTNGDLGLGTTDPSILPYSHPTRVMTLQEEFGATSIEMSGNRTRDGQSVGWITHFNDGNRILDMYTTREDHGKSGSWVVRTNNGTGGINAENMVRQFTITHEGDVYLNDKSNGVIMRSPNGLCWKYTAQNDGSMKSIQVTCP